MVLGFYSCWCRHGFQQWVSGSTVECWLRRTPCQWNHFCPVAEAAGLHYRTCRYVETFCLPHGSLSGLISRTVGLSLFIRMLVVLGAERIKWENRKYVGYICNLLVQNTYYPACNAWLYYKWDFLSHYFFQGSQRAVFLSSQELCEVGELI